MRRPKFYKFGGLSLTVAQWAERLDISRIGMYKRLCYYGESSPRTFAFGRQRSSWGRRLTHNGVTDTVSGWAERLGVKRRTLDNRLHRGLAMEDVLSSVRLCRNLGSPGRQIEFRGKTQNMAAWARELGISRERVRQRLATRPVERALDLGTRSGRWRGLGRR